MSNEVFYWLLNMSLHGGIVCLIVLALRKLPFLPHGVRYWLWTAPLLRLAFPISLSTEFSLAALLKNSVVREVPLALPSDWRFAMINSVQMVENYGTMEYVSSPAERFFSVATVVWFAVAGALLLAAVWFYGRTMVQLRDAVPAEKGVYVSQRVNAPALYGVLRPRIILPPAVSGREYVLLHERVHLRRLDNLWRMVAIAVCCVHWFNPVVWISLRFFLEDMELSCDAAAVSKLSVPERKAYALALVDAVQRTSVFTSAFGGAGLQGRVKTVLTYRNLTAVSASVFGILASALIAFLTLN